MWNMNKIVKHANASFPIPISFFFLTSIKSFKWSEENNIKIVFTQKPQTTAIAKTTRNEEKHQSFHLNEETNKKILIQE